MNLLQFTKLFFNSIALCFLLNSIGLANAQNNSYRGNAMWQELSKLEGRGESKKAYELAEKIYIHSKKNHNPVDQIRALLIKERHQQVITESITPAESTLKSLNQLLNETSEPTKAIVHSLIAQLLWGYYSENRYRFGNRTLVAKPSDHQLETPQSSTFDNLESWDLKTILETIRRHFHLSLKSKQVLQQARTQDYVDILVNFPSANDANKNHQLRPTLFDVLAQQALQFLTNPESSLANPKDIFRLFQPDLYRLGQQFLSVPLPQSSSLGNDALSIYKDLIAFHLSQKNRAALVDWELQRIEFIHKHQILENKNVVYLDALRQLIASEANDPAVAEVYERMAQSYIEDFPYNAKTATNNQWYRKKAVDTCRTAIGKFPRSRGAALCERLVQRIIQKQINIKTPNVVAPEDPFPIAVSSTNVDKVFIRTIPVKVSEYKSIVEKKQDAILVELKSLLKRKPIFERRFPLPDAGDYHETYVELPMESLPVGHYIMFFSSQADFSDITPHHGWVTMQSSHINFVIKNGNNNEIELYTVDRLSGQPLPYTEVIIGNPTNSRLMDSSELDQLPNIKRLKTDASGVIRINEATLDNAYRYCWLKNGNDVLWAQEMSIYPRPSELSSKNLRIFTDRAIYRPGQMVYFKGLKLQHNTTLGGYSNKVAANEATTIGFYNANGELIQEKKFVSDDFGTFSGEFIIPNSGLTGSFRIGNEFGNTFVQIEEYKRPKFEISFEPFTEAIQLGDRSRIVGTVKSYAGANLANATVKYRVTRESQLPLGSYWRRWWQPKPPTEIAFGEVQTQANGQFVIEFEAKADPGIDPKTKPHFLFKVAAEVTDIAGETQMAQSTIKVGYESLQVASDLPTLIDIGTYKSTAIKVTNLNDVEQVVTGMVSITPLRLPVVWKRPRLWPSPTLNWGPKPFNEQLLRDEYLDSYEMHNWNHEGQTQQKRFDTSQSKIIDLSELIKKPGAYEVKWSLKDQKGNGVEKTEYISVTDASKKSMPYAKLDWFLPIKTEVTQGESAKILFGSSSQLRVLYEIERIDGNRTTTWLDINNEQKVLEIPITQQDQGLLVVRLFYAHANRVLMHEQIIKILNKKDELKIKIQALRDRMLPGQSEQLDVTITDHENKPVFANIVATLYDAALDSFKKLEWDIPKSFVPRQPFFNWSLSNPYVTFGSIREDLPYIEVLNKSYPTLNLFGLRLASSAPLMMEVEMMASGNMEAVRSMPSLPVPSFAAPMHSRAKNAEQAVGDSNPTVAPLPALRTNFQETAFFQGQIRTNEKGHAKIKFTMPDTLTRWNLKMFAMTKDIQTGEINQSIITQKDLMITPNLPRFLRSGDEIFLMAKVDNLSQTVQNGTVKLSLFDIEQGKPIISDWLVSDGKSKDSTSANSEIQNIVLSPLASQVRGWMIKIPKDHSAVRYRFEVRTDKATDAEEGVLPIITNRQLVTESLALPVRKAGTTTFNFDRLASNLSKTASHHALTLEFTPNPVWYAVQALPYLIEFPYECIEQTFTRYYANRLGSYIVASKPKIQTIFKKWEEGLKAGHGVNKDALISNVLKNQELKQVLIEETPWVLEAKDEGERKKRLGMLMDLKTLSTGLESTLTKLRDEQLSNGAWGWFKGMQGDRWMTQHIVASFGQLHRLTGENINTPMLNKALQYLDQEFLKVYKQQLNSSDSITKISVDNITLHYLYTRSYYPQPIGKEIDEAMVYYRGLLKKSWRNDISLSSNRFMQGMMALVFHRANDRAFAKSILAAIHNSAVQSPEMGMYWKMAYGFNWDEAPIETQSLLIEAFHEITNDQESIEAMKVWLLKQKQTQDWKTTKATANAIYALLLRGNNWLSLDQPVVIKVGDMVVNTEGKAEAGTGYFKHRIQGSDIQPNMSRVTITKPTEGVSWGALYWQYFEELDQITNTPNAEIGKQAISIDKKLFKLENSNDGPVLHPISPQMPIKVGDLVKVKMVIKVDRKMDYVHIKDMRASGLEPVNVISQYRVQDGLGYYESTRDTASHFFIDHLYPGVYVFEYMLKANNSGDFSNGITTIQSMYAPEFAAHSEGIRLRIAKNLQ